MSETITKIMIDRFRSLRAIDVPLKPVTILIGENDTGKTSFLHALIEVVHGHPIVKSDRWRAGADGQVAHVSAVFSDTRNTVISSDRPEQPQKVELMPVFLYNLPAQGINMLSDGYNDLAGPQLLDSSAQNVASLFDYLLRRDRVRFNAAVEAIKRLAPGVEDLTISTPVGAQRQLNLVIENGFELPGQAISTGVRLLIVFVALAYHPRPPRLILIEEPENGIHPRRLKNVVDLLREIAAGKHGSNSAQVIITTHSPYLLDMVNLEKEQVLVFRRNADGGRTAAPADKERLKIFLDEFKLGEVWFNQGEEGLIAKQQ
jgi:predicted ATPase